LRPATPAGNSENVLPLGKPTQLFQLNDPPGFIPDDRGKTVTKPLALSRLGLLLSEKQIPQVVENLESGVKRKEALERAIMRPRQVRYQAALRPDI
jgi:hypothetical protein